MRANVSFDLTSSVTPAKAKRKLRRSDEDQAVGAGAFADAGTPHNPNDLLDPRNWPNYGQGQPQQSEPGDDKSQSAEFETQEFHEEIYDETEERDDGDARLIQVAENQGQPQQRAPQQGQQRRNQRPARPPRPYPTNPLTAGSNPRGHDTQGDIPPVPAIRRELFNTPRMREGWDHVDAKNGASSGITRDTWNNMRARGALPEDLRGYAEPKDIPTDRRPEVMRAYFGVALRNAGGAGALEQIPDPLAARALASAIYYQGENAGARAIQAAIRRVGTPEELANDPTLPGNRQNNPKLRDESTVGPWTLETYSRIAADPDRHEALLNALSEERIREHTKRWGDPGEGGRQIINWYRPATRRD